MQINESAAFGYQANSSGSVSSEVSDKLQFVARNDKLKLIGHQTDPLPSQQFALHRSAHLLD